MDHYCIDPDEGDSGGDWNELYITCTASECSFKETLFSLGYPKRELSPEEREACDVLYQKEFTSLGEVKERIK
jgi:hypothetical protein